MDACKLSGLFILALAVAACGKDPGDLPPPAPPAPPSTSAPLPAFPSWAQPLIGTKAAAPTASGCLGAFDVVVTRHIGAAPGVEAEGWGWLSQSKAAPSHILFVDYESRIVGAAETVRDRPDVPKAIPDVSTQRVGWHGSIGLTNGDVKALALLPDNSTCLLGDMGVGTKS